MTGRAAAVFIHLVLLGLLGEVRAESVLTLVSNGPTSQRINLTFFSEGYTSAELPNFVTDVQQVLNSFFLTPPYNTYSNCFNVFAVSVASADSGSDHYTPLPARLVNTYFNSSFDNYGTDRVLMIPPNSHDQSYANGQGKVDALVASLVPESDVEIVLVNDPDYGGTGGSLLVVSLDPSSPEIALHEMGHTLAKLGDEYSDYLAYGNQEEPNTTTQTVRELIKWNSWILPETPIPTPDVPANFTAVGLFEGAHYHTTGWFRPQHNCKMRALGAPYCAICREAIVLSIYSLVRPIESFSPVANVVSLTNLQTLRVKPIGVAGGTFTCQWFTNDVLVLGANKTNLLLTPQMLGPGTHSVRVEVHDATTFVRNDPSRLLFDTNSWIVTVPVILAITDQPQDQSIIAGATAQFSVGVTGQQPIRFQWRHEGTPLDGQTNAMLSFIASAGTSGAYDAVVANDSASLTSSVAVLTVETPAAPTIVVSPTDQTARVGQSATFQVVATGSSPRSFFWIHDSVIIATSGVPLLTLDPVEFSHAGTYSVIVSNVAGMAVSATATLTVLPAEPPGAGAFSGLFFNSNDLQQASSGLFNVTVQNDGDFIARLQIGAKKQSFRGRFGEDGRASNVVSLAGVPLRVMLRSVTDSEAIVGQVNDGGWSAPLLAYRVNADARFAGQYNLLVGGADDPADGPLGNGFAQVRVKNGVATFSGTAADGARLSARVSIVGEGLIPFYSFAGKGIAFGWLRLKPATDIDLDGAVNWISPANTLGFPTGFTLSAPAIGSSYERSIGTLFNAALAKVILIGTAPETSRTNYVTLGSGGRVTSAGPDKIQLKVQPANGLFTGTISPTGKKPIKIRGAILQRQRFGGGFFLGTNDSGRVYFGP